MVVYLDLTEEIIESFNKCVKSGDYKPFLKENQTFLGTLANNLKYVEFEKNRKYYWISKEFSYCLRYLTEFDPKKPKEKISGVGNLEKNVPEIPSDIKDGISRKDWSDFYLKYRPIADHMISEARKQEIIEFTITLGSNGFETFVTRDEYFAYRNEEVVQLPPALNVHSTEFKNSRAMVQYATEAQKFQTNPKKVTNIKIHLKSSDPSLPYVGDDQKPAYHSARTSQVTGNMAQNRSIGTGGGIELTPEVDNLKQKYGSRGSSNTSEPVEKDQRRSSRLAAKKNEKLAESTSDSSKKEGVLKRMIKKKLGKSDKDKSGKTESQDSEGLNSSTNDTSQQYFNESLNYLKNKPQGNNTLFKQESFSDVPLKYAAELNSGNNHRSGHFDLPKNPTVNLRQASLNRDSPELDNSAFEQQLREQNLRNSRHLEEVRAERRRKQAEFEKELQKMREESKKRFEALLACILMKHRFEEQEQNWKDWIQGCRNHIMDLCNRCADFVQDVHRNHGGFRKPEKVDLEDFQSDKGYLLGKTMMTLNAIQFDFEHLKSIEEKYPDALFVRVLQSCLVKTAHIIFDIYHSLQNLGPDKNEFQQFQDKTVSLTPNMIYSTTDLHRICRGDVTENYENIQFPDFPQSVTFQEVYN